MKCIVCGNSFQGKRSDSKYCSNQCSNQAKQDRQKQKIINNVQNNFSPIDTPGINGIGLSGIQELRVVEKDHYSIIREMENKHRDKLKTNENQLLRQEFKIERLEDKIKDLIETHRTRIAELSRNTTKETINAISAMPAAQQLLGTLASNMLPGTTSNLGSVDNNYSDTEIYLIKSLRKLPSDLNNFMTQMQAIFFQKSEKEQRSMCKTLTQFMQSDNSDDI